MSLKPVILVVEDDPPVMNLISAMLESSGYKYVQARDGAEAILEAGCKNPDIILMDLGLPDMDGIYVIEKIRSWSAAPILVISARTQESDKISALNAGADDYITKPFSVEEMLARIRAMQRRMAMLQSEKHETTTIYRNGPLKIDYLGNSVFIDDQEIHLSNIEYKLLALLAKNTGKVLTSAYIAKEIWQTAWDSDLANLRVYMTMLRKKLAKSPACSKLIQTRIGVGYKMIRLDEPEETCED